MSAASSAHGVPRARALLSAAVAERVASAAALAVVDLDRVEVFSVGRTSQWRRVGAQGRWEPCPGTPVHNHSRFDLASLTKPMATSTLLALACAKGLVSLEDPLERWLPESRSLPLGSVPLRLFASHASGLPAWVDFFAATQGMQGSHRAQAVRRQVMATPLDRAPGSQAVYSDLGYMLLGWTLEAAWQAPLDQLFDRHIALPLGLCAGFKPPATEAVVCTEIWPPRCIDGLPLRAEVHDDNAAALEGVAGHAGLFASAADVGRWAQQWLRAASGQANDLELDPRLVAQWPLSAGAPETTWRCGWDTPSRPHSSAGERAPPGAFGHLGFAGTSVWLAPDRRLAVALLTNRVHPSREHVSGIRRLRPAVHDALWPDGRAGFL